MKKSFTIRDLPVEERPRERLKKFGPESLSIQELLQIILSSGNSGESVAILAQKLISHFGSLQKLKEASLEELMEIKGIGLAKACKIKALFELGKRAEIFDLKKRKKKILSPQDIFKIIKNKIKDFAKEHFYIICLNTRNVVISEISIGIIDASLVHPREVFAEAIKQRASSIILCHNHPSGDPTPSQDDIEVTKRLIKSGAILGIQVIDHIIVAKDKYFSFKSKGLIKEIET